MASTRHLFRPIIAAALCGAGAAPLLAQTAQPVVTDAQGTPPDASPTQNEQSPREDIVVTATRRAESVQRVPIAISAYSGDDLQTRGILSPQDLQRTVPSLSFGTQQNNPGITLDVSIRGVSSPNSLPGGDPGVPIHMNGHYLQAANFLARDLLDIERIEVLRGPQGTLYGRNANGGSVNIITKQPTDQLEGIVSAEFGNYSMRGFQGVLNVPLTDGIRARFAAAHKYRDGYVRNISTASEQDRLLVMNYVSLRGQVDIDLGPDITTRWGGYYYSNQGQLAIFQLTSFGPINRTGSAYFAALPPGARFQSDRDNRTVDFDQRLDGSDKSHGFNFSGDWDVGPVVLKVLAAHNFSQTEVPLDLDNTSVVDATNNFNNFVEYNTDTAEFQVVSDTTGPLSFVLGANYYDEDSFLTNPFSSPPQVSGIFVYTSPYAEYTARAYGVFGNVEYKLTERLTLFGGARYNNDRKSIGVTNITFYDRSLIPDPSNLLFIPRNPYGFELFRQSATFESVNFRAGANFFVRDGLMVYGSVSTGYRPGGFNADSTGDSLYRKETTTAYEVGLKSNFFDRRLQLNLAGFLTEYRDRQEARTVGVPSFGPDGQFIGNDFRSEFTNVPKSRVWGVEAESTLAITDELKVDVSVGYLNATITSDFIGADQFRPALGLAANFRGNDLPWTPRVKLNAGAQYDREISPSFGTVSARVDYSYVEDQYSEYFNRTPQNTANRPEGIISNFIPAYHTVNLALGWRNQEKGLRVDAVVSNLLNDDSITSIKPAFQASAGTNSNWVDYRPPRFISVKVTKNF